MAGPSSSRSLWADPANHPVLKKLGIFTTLMVALPLGLFYGTKAMLVNVSDSDKLLYAGFMAVIGVNIVSAMYIFMALQEDKTTRDTNVDSTVPSHSSDEKSKTS
eukprot:GILK01012898.1.p1 GENE.GILK01012898.1~~GILK01012898.1.p1  ORF type:complete len:105 (+),score=7.40 GILK01012898.1:45-359(+)